MMPQSLAQPQEAHGGLCGGGIITPAILEVEERELGRDQLRLHENRRSSHCVRLRRLGVVCRETSVAWSASPSARVLPTALTVGVKYEPASASEQGFSPSASVLLTSLAFRCQNIHGKTEISRISAGATTRG